MECDACGKMQECPISEDTHRPLKPINPDTGKLWWSRIKDGSIELHACSEPCRDKLGGPPPLLMDLG